MNHVAPFTSRMIVDFASLQSLADDWTSLWSRSTRATTFQRPEWVLAWTEAFSPKELLVVEVRQQDRLVGLAPLFCYRAGNERILAPLAASISDYIDWLVEPEHSAGIIQMIMTILGNSKDSWDRLDLTDVPSTSSLLNFDFSGWDCERAIETVCPVLSIPAAAKNVEEILSAKPRHNLRTARRRTSKIGESRVEIATKENLNEFLEAMFRLHHSRWSELGSAGVLSDSAIQVFHRLAAHAFLEKGILRLYGLRLHGKLIATLYALEEANALYCYLQGFDPMYRELSPGAQILAAVIDDAIRAGISTVDFLRGKEAYKYLWGAQDRQTYRLCIRTKTTSKIPPLAA